MPDDDLLPPAVPDPVTTVPPAPRSTRIVCEFCQCELDPRGAVLKRGDTARTYLDLEDENKGLRGQLDTLRADNTELSRQLEAYRNPPKRKGFLD